MPTTKKPSIAWSKSRRDMSTVENQRVTNSMINMKQLNKKKTLPLVIRGTKSNSKIAARMWVRKCCSGENKIRLCPTPWVLRLNQSLWQQLRKTVVFLFSTNGQFQNRRPTVKLLSRCQTDDLATLSNSPSINGTHDWRLAAWKLNAGLSRNGANQCVLCTYVAMMMLSNTAVFSARDYLWNNERSFKASRHSFPSES